MTEEERRDFAEWLGSPKSEMPLALELIKAHKDGGLYFEVPETNGFPANRFAGRLLGYMYAVVADRIKPEEEFRINVDTIRPFISNEEVDALEKLQLKIKEQEEKGIPPFDDGYIGRLEGIVIFIDIKDLSLLYSETDIDLNRGCDANGIPSYAFHRSHLKAGLQLAKCDKPRAEVIHMLMKDGLKEKGATMITDRMIEVIRQQRKKAALKGIGMGFLFLIGGALITGWTYYSAISNGGGRYLFTYGAIIGGIFMLVLGTTNYLKASRYKG